MTIKQWPIDKPQPYAKNARKIPQKAIDKVALSLREFGWQQPIVVDTAGVIVVGHTRLLAARAEGMTTVPVHVASALSADQIKAYRLMDNRSHEESAWDWGLLLADLTDLVECDMSSLAGFDESELTKLLKSADEIDAVSRLGGLEYRIVLECKDEQDQALMIDRFQREGLTCRALTS